VKSPKAPAGAADAEAEADADAEALGVSLAVSDSAGAALGSALGVESPPQPASTTPNRTIAAALEGLAFTAPLLGWPGGPQGIRTTVTV